MGVAGQRQRAVLRVALAQAPQPLAQEVARAPPTEVALAVVEAGGREVEIRRQLPDPLRLARSARRGRRRRRWRSASRAGRARPRRRRAAAARPRGRRAPRRSRRPAVRSRASSASSGSRRISRARARRASRFGTPNGSRATHSALTAKRRALSGKRWWFGSRPKASLAAVGVGDAQQALAAEVDVEARLLERPVRRHLDARDARGSRRRRGSARARRGRAGAPSKVQPSSGDAARGPSRARARSAACGRRSMRCSVGQRHDGSFSRRSRRAPGRLKSPPGASWPGSATRPSATLRSIAGPQRPRGGTGPQAGRSMPS